jgi:hypothetical protein
MYDQPAQIIVTAGELRLSFEHTANGIILLSLLDTATEQELLASKSLPLFTIKMRNVKSGDEKLFNSDSDWNSVGIEESDNLLAMNWDAENLKVEVHGKLDSDNSAVYWDLKVDNNNRDLSIMSVMFPQIAVADLGADGCVFFPRGPGEVQKNLWNRSFRHSGLYPEPWTVMQFVSAYNKKTGIYVATHDPNASTKEITIESKPEDKSVVFTYDIPAENIGIGGNGFTLSGCAVWKLLRGDWYDSAMIYRNWLKKEARWFPEIGADGRSDTPEWMREICVWATTGGNAEQVIPRVKKFAEYMDVPVAFHWYNWHQIPFDNDYPHYFPVTDGFAEGVQNLQKAGIFVMPYINGRLWDTHDKGTEDYEFTSVALPATTKDEKGEPYVEMYGSKESDDSPVRFAVMCPATELWQNRIRDICLKLINEYNVNSVYIDQISAMSPKLCQDKTHRHPLGGGHWWVEGYWKMLQSIRDAMPKDRMLTSECNAEPYIKWFDGYLSWTWQHDGQVPAFPAVYAGAIQNFGRAYRGGTTSDLALRMKAGQQLVFGEQIGWIDPGVIEQKENAEFMRQVVQLRWQIRRYFYAGEMLRPPELIGNIPDVKADWQWAGEWWVTTPAVLTGAWKLPQNDKLVMIFVNVSDETVSAKLNVNTTEYGITDKELKLIIIDSESHSEKNIPSSELNTSITINPRTAIIWEILIR